MPLPSEIATVPSSASVDVTPLPAAPTSSRLPSARSQRSGSTRCRSGSSTSPMIPWATLDSSTGSRYGNGANHGEAGGRAPTSTQHRERRRPAHRARCHRPVSGAVHLPFGRSASRRAEPHHRAARQSARYRRRRASPTTSMASAGVVQPQRQPQVGVGADVVADDAARSLRRQDQMHTETATALGDADESMQEVGLLAARVQQIRR